MALIVGSIIGVGIFNLPTSLAFYGPITLVSLALTTVGALVLALLFASLSRRLPADGGPYAYARVAFGNRLGFTITDDPAEAVAGADFIHTDAWVPMGESKDVWDERVHLLAPYQVNASLVTRPSSSCTACPHSMT
jgi:amino acid transporter